MSHKKTLPLSYTVVSIQREGAPRTVARLVCACGHSDDVVLTKGHNPSIVGPKFVTLGWTFDKNTARLCRCPACILVRQESRRSVSSFPDLPPIESPLRMAALCLPPDLEPAVMAAQIPTQSSDAMKQQRHLYELLDRHFVPETGLYSDGWDDAKVATGVGLSVPYVVAVRDAAYGPLAKPDPVLGKIADDIALLEVAQSILTDDIDKASANLAGLKLSFDGMKRDLDDLRSRFLAHKPRKAA